jgi:hypothetical protein
MPVDNMRIAVLVRYSRFRLQGNDEKSDGAAETIF